MLLYITGALNTVLGPEHRKEIIRYIYNHQVELFIKPKVKKFSFEKQTGENK